MIALVPRGIVIIPDVRDSPTDTECHPQKGGHPKVPPYRVVNRELPQRPATHVFGRKINGKARKKIVGPFFLGGHSDTEEEDKNGYMLRVCVRGGSSGCYLRHRLALGRDKNNTTH